MKFKEIMLALAIGDTFTVAKPAASFVTAKRIGIKVKSAKQADGTYLITRIA